MVDNRSIEWPEVGVANGLLNPGEVFAGYTVERLVGAGGAGAVYVAQDPRLPRRVALKVLHAQMLSNASARTRFEREADHVARLDHPNIVMVFDRGVVGGQLWIAMQHVPGTDADKELAQGPLHPLRVLHIVTEVAKALDYAHSAGVLHRDVKPANILLNGDRVLLTDFGIAIGADEHSRLTETGTLVATLHYVAPEYLEGEPLDPRADVYSLACTFYRLLTGYPPFHGPTAASVMRGHLSGPIPRLRDSRADLPDEVDAVLGHALAKRREDRYRSAGEFVAAAAQALGQVPASTRNTGPIGWGAQQPPTGPPLDPKVYVTTEPTDFGATAQATPPPDHPAPLPTEAARTRAQFAQQAPESTHQLPGSPGPPWGQPHPSAPPARPSAPAPARRRKPVLVAALVLVVGAVAAVALVVALTRGGGQNSGVFAALPAGYTADHCSEVAEPGSGADTEVDCQPPEQVGPPGYFYRFGDVASVKDAYQRTLGERDVVECPNGLYSSTWQYSATPDADAGEIACAQDYDGNPQLIWTKEDELMMGIVGGSAVEELYRWWNGATL